MIDADVEAVIGRIDSWDPLATSPQVGVDWATSNLGEAMPGVQTPLSLTLWIDAVEHAPREAAYQIGALRSAERGLPARARDRLIRPFYGRPAIKVAFFAELGDRMPGTTGRETVVSILGRAPQDIVYAPTARRYPIIAARLPWTFARTPAKIRALATEQTSWYGSALEALQRADLDRATEIFAEAAVRHDRALVTQVCGIFGVIQPLHDAVVRLVEKLGVGDVSTLTGASGGAEMAVVTDIWAVSRGRLELAEVIRRHGFHGPGEGELSSRVWREDDAPLRAMVHAYAGRDESADPVAHDQARRAARPAVEQEVIDAVPLPARPVVRLLLRLSRERLPLRGTCKRAFLQSFDVARAAARRAGEQLAERGALDAPDDVFYLTVDELTGGIPDDAKELVRRRRERRIAYQAMTIPSAWRGTVQPVRADSADAFDHAHDHDGQIIGVGVSAGIVEGIARVLLEPDFATVEPDEIITPPCESGNAGW